MKMWRSFALIACAPFAALALPADYFAPQMGAFEVGITCSPEVINTATAPDTTHGEINIITPDFAFISPARQVPGVLGISFGIRGMTSGLGDVPVTVITRHPPMGPERRTQQIWDSAMADDSFAVALFSFDFPYEIVLGNWSFTAVHNGTVLYEVHFEVVTPQQQPDLAEICGYTDLLS